MKWSSAFRASKKTLKSGALFWCTLLSAVAVYWLIVSANLWFDLSRQKSSPVTIPAMGNIGDAVIAEMSKPDGVLTVSEKKTFAGTLLYGEYRQPVTIYGVNTDYMCDISGLSDMNFNGAMPYVLLDEAAAFGFMNEDKEKLEVTDISEFVMKTVTLDGEVPVDLRIVGTVEALDSGADDTGVSENQTENLPADFSGGSLYISLDWFEKLWPSDDSVAEGGELLIRLENGSYIESVSNVLSKYNIFVNESYTSKWAQMAEAADAALYKGVLAFCCVVLIGYYEFKFLQLKYKNTIEYMHWLSGGRPLTKIWLCRYTIAAAAAVLAGLIYWGLRTIFIV